MLAARRHRAWDAAATAAPPTSPPETAEQTIAEVLPSPKFAAESAPPPRYRVRAGAGAEVAGELNAEAAGLAVPGQPPADWLLQYSKRWRTLGGWQPLGKLRATPRGQQASLRWSKPLMKDDDASVPVDGSGLELHLETSFERPNEQPQRALGPNMVEAQDEGTVGVACQQRVEVVAGPRAQARYLNLTLPVGLLVGLSAATPPQDENAEEGTIAQQGPLTFYARLTMPGLRELRGWACEADVEDSWAGLLRGQIMRPWRRQEGETGFGGRWQLEHLRQHGAIAMPRLLADTAAAIAAAAQDKIDLLTGGSGLPPNGFEEAAMVPTTRLRAGSEGPGAAMSLESSQAGLGGAGWGTSGEVNRNGWGARLSLAGDRRVAMGQPQYSLTAQAPWKARPAVTHELKWMLADGQGVWFTVRNGTNGPRLNMGLEIR